MKSTSAAHRNRIGGTIQIGLPGRLQDNDLRHGEWKLKAGAGGGAWNAKVTRGKETRLGLERQAIMTAID